MTLISIWAQGHGRVIGKDGTVPWHVPEDLALFKRVTIGHPVIMGRVTWQSLPEKFRPLPGRRNIIVTRDPDFVADGGEIVTSLEQARAATQGETAYVMGGASIYEAAMSVIDGIIVTDIDVPVEGGDAHAPALPDWDIVAANPDRGWHHSTSGADYRFTALARPGTTPFGPDPLGTSSAITTSETL